MTKHTDDSRPLSPARRGLVFSLVALPFAAGSMAWLRGSQNHGRRLKPGNALEWQLSVADAKSRGQGLLATYPQPRWLPKNFQIQSTTACSEAPSQRGAFLDVEDRKQLCFSAIRDNARSHGEFINSGLNIFVAPLAKMSLLRGKVPEATPLTIEFGGETVEAHYYDSYDNRASFGAVHCVAFHRNGFGVLISSFHKNRLTRDDLERIAAHVV